MCPARSPAPQQAPVEFASMIQRLRDTRDPRLNALLAAARRRGWRATTLAHILGSTENSCLKRVERGTPASEISVARKTLRKVARRLSAMGYDSAAEGMRWLARSDQPTAALEAAGQILRAGQLPASTRRSMERQLARATAYRQPPPADLTGLSIPDPPPPAQPMMMNGRRLPAGEVHRLQDMQAVAAKVNGALPPGHPNRKVSEQFTQELADLIEGQGFSAYYLANALGVTTRAITSRLERHGYRKPVPSAANTSSGQYRNRKIGS